MNIPYIITDSTLTFSIDGLLYPVHRGSHNFDAIVDQLNSPNCDKNVLVDLYSAASALRSTFADDPDGENYLLKGIIDITEDGVTFNGHMTDTALSDRLLDAFDAGLNLGPWVRFAENVYQNPADYAIEELYEWLANSDLPITSDGCFLAYKIVDPDYKDLRTHTFDNSVGAVVQLENREDVDSDRNNLCSYGLHFCSKDYLPQYGNSHGNRIVVVKINPADVVSIPTDHQYAKGRTWRYEVIDEISREEASAKVWAPVYEDIVDTESDEEPTELEIFAARKANILAENSTKSLRKQARLLGCDATSAWRGFDRDELAQFIAENE